MHVFDILKDQLIVACTPDPAMGADPGVYLDGLIRAVESGGGAGVRVEGVENVQRIRKMTSLPIIGFVLGAFADGAELITPTLEDAVALAHAGADIIAIDGTNRKRPSGKDGYSFLDEVRNAVSVPILCDISTFAEGIRCAETGADAIATTLAGTLQPATGDEAMQPDFTLIEELSASTVIPVIAEGRIIVPAQAAAAMQSGAHAVVVGSAITRPSFLTKIFANSLHANTWGNF